MNIKKIAASLLAVVMVASSMAIGTFAVDIGIAEGTLDDATGLLYVPLDDGTLKVTCPDGATLEGDIVIPETFGEGDDLKTVTEVDVDIMSSSNVTTVSIPKSVIRISNPYFASLTQNLKEIYVDEENQFFTSVDGVLFNKDKTEIIKYPPAKIGTSYSIPSTVTIVRQWCFDKSELEAIVIPNSVRQLENAAFSSCSNLTELNIPSSVEMIAGSPIDNSGVTTINVDSENTYYSSVDGVLFTADLKTLVAYPVANNAKEYLVPIETEIIGEQAFWSAKNLVSIEIPNKVTELLYGTFMNCYSLETVTLPLELKIINNNAFHMFVFEYDGIQYTPTPALKTINYAGVQEDWDKIEIGFGNDILKKATIYFSDGTTGGADVPDIVDTVVQEPDVTVNEDGTVDFTPGVKKNITTSDADIETMKAITANAPADAFDDDVVLKVSRDTFAAGGNSSFAVDISFVKEDGTKAQPKEGTKVTVKIPVPESLKTKDPLFVYHVNDNGKAEKVEAKTEEIGGVKYVVFEADHFSTYALTDKEIEETTPATPTTPTTPSTPSDPAVSESSPAVSDTTSNEPTSSATTVEPASSDNTTSSAPITSDNNPSTGVAAVSVLPIAAVVSAVVIISKKKK